MKMIEKEMKKRENFENARRESLDSSNDKKRNGSSRRWQCSRDTIIISANNKWKKAFDIFIVILALYSTYTSTFLYSLKLLYIK